MSRPRAHIPLRELLASALADKLPTIVADGMRQRKEPAENVIAMFTPDHIVLHAWDGEDKWHNLDMRMRGPELKKKDAADTSRAAKAVRIDRDNAEHRRRLLAKSQPEPQPRSRWPKRKLQSRGFA